MKFEVDIDKLIDNSISLNQYFLCSMIYQQDNRSLNYYIEQFGPFGKSDFDKLINEEYIGMHNSIKGYVFSNFFITKKFIHRFIEKEKLSKLDINNSVESWIDIWYNLFPKGVKSGGYLVRSDKVGCLNKMKKFIKNNPDFTRDIILKATSDYIDYMRMKNYGYMSLAHYFIYKNDMSILAGQCEAILDKIKDGREVNLSLNQYKIAESIEDESDIFGNNNMMERL